MARLALLFVGTAGYVLAAAGCEPVAGPKIGERFRDCAECPEMVVVPAGSFLMGWRESEDGQDWPASALPMRRYYFPGPVHPVSIAAPFAVGVYEVTFSEWDACEEDGGCRGYSPNDRGWGRGQRPVINVNWADAQAYVQWLSEKTGKPYRLPPRQRPGFPEGGDAV